MDANSQAGVPRDADEGPGTGAPAHGPADTAVAEDRISRTHPPGHPTGPRQTGTAGGRGPGPARRPHETVTTASISVAMPSGRAATPIAERACRLDGP
ncbi:hypothetical protein Psuf_080200 [Phytohabitans suffuscus]|uniref:Uncharacterized protein n=1 Tax=Phytohabitans suffuscus TaxID=624315 RepID=A0A6F8YX44_9ACTN|nr:hypothetical protein Psuf_080200 [Phytohabitans suffuscus]